MSLSDLIVKLNRQTGSVEYRGIKQDVVLVWTAEEKRVITGVDILDRLLHEIELVD